MEKRILLEECAKFAKNQLKQHQHNELIHLFKVSDLENKTMYGILEMLAIKT